MLLTLAAGPMLAGSRPAGLLSSPESCGREMLALHGVWITPELYVPLFADLDLVAYLTAVGKEAAGHNGQGPVVLPVYSPNPFHFRRGPVVFLSTASILAAESEHDIFSAIRSELPKASHERSEQEPEIVQACSTSPTAARPPLLEVQSSLAAQVAGYDSRFGRHLKRR